MKCNDCGKPTKEGHKYCMNCFKKRMNAEMTTTEQPEQQEAPPKLGPVLRTEVKLPIWVILLTGTIIMFASQIGWI